MGLGKLLDLRPTEGPVKSPLSLRLSLCPSVCQFGIFLRNDFFRRKIHFCPNLGKKVPKWTQNRVFWIFWKSLSLGLLGNNKKTNVVIDISSPVPYLAKLWFSSCGPKCCWPIKLQDSPKCNVSRKKGMMKLIFSMQINIKVFYELMLSFWVCVGSPAQSTQNKKFAYLCNITRKAWMIKLI